MPNGGLLFTAFTPYSEQKGALSESHDRPNTNSQKSISESSENISKPRPMKHKQKKKEEEQDKFMDTQAFHSTLESNSEVIENWNQVRNLTLISSPIFYLFQRESLVLYYYYYLAHSTDSTFRAVLRQLGALG